MSASQAVERVQRWVASLLIMLVPCLPSFRHLDSKAGLHRLREHAECAGKAAITLGKECAELRAADQVRSNTQCPECRRTRPLLKYEDHLHFASPGRYSSPCGHSALQASKAALRAAAAAANCGRGGWPHSARESFAGSGKPIESVEFCPLIPTGSMQYLTSNHDIFGQVCCILYQQSA